MRRLVVLLCAALCAMGVTSVMAPLAAAVVDPWFGNAVGNATQVVSVVGVGHSTAKIDAYQRTTAGWEPVAAGISAHVGSAGITPQTKEGEPSTPMGIYTLDSAFGTAPNPGGGLPYVQVGSDHWWDSDSNSPTYNTMQICKKAQCPFNTAVSENLNIPQYRHAVVIGVNKSRTPGDGSAYFFHTTDGGPTAGCVAIDDTTLVKIIGWLRPGALMAIAK
ncbi:L,D-transpeptidase family protein [[Mycobacterium] nativiensis]|uniref:L,D-transpeptidase family protein n=1 Tax=[Mycobacterium] nativiensis TaxID=2855503 RepID=A0ABU5Y5F0_9MYCO|nr:L,D-transpeptidase family protein [Mycolicibacter sp. MYC340]MEB3034466.1 L,D-transpeptidase family protein [Mycolicibacter sp. MYC340]